MPEGTQIATIRGTQVAAISFLFLKRVKLSLENSSWKGITSRDKNE